MQALLKQAWWALLVGGLASVIFGVLAFMWPGLTLFILAVFFAATVFVDGIVTMASAVRNRATASHWWVWLLLGLLGVVSGAITYGASRGRRDFTSQSQIVAGRYDVLCQPRNAEKARDMLSKLALGTDT